MDRDLDRVADRMDDPDFDLDLDTDLEAERDSDLLELTLPDLERDRDRGERDRDFLSDTTAAEVFDFLFFLGLLDLPSTALVLRLTGLAGCSASFNWSGTLLLEAAISWTESAGAICVTGRGFSSSAAVALFNFCCC